MERLTEYHCDVAVIRDKNLLPQAMDKLATYEDMEEQGQIQIMDCNGCTHKSNKSFCLNCKRGGCRDYFLTE